MNEDLNANLTELLEIAAQEEANWASRYESLSELVPEGPAKDVLYTLYLDKVQNNKRMVELLQTEISNADSFSTAKAPFLEETYQAENMTKYLQENIWHEVESARFYGSILPLFSDHAISSQLTLLLEGAQNAAILNQYLFSLSFPS